MSKQNAVACLYLFRSFQKRNRFISQAYSTPLSPAESHLLTEIRIYGVALARDLALVTSLDKVFVAINIKKLAQRGLVRVAKGANDSRTRPISLTTKGREILKTHDREADTLLDEFCTPFSTKEKNEFRELLTRFAEKVWPQGAKSTSSEHPLRAPIRALTRAAAMLTGKIFNSSLTTLHWHILREIEEGRVAPFIKEISSELRTPQNTTSQAITELVRRGFVSRAPFQGGDKRRQVLMLTNAGVRELRSVESRGIEMMRRGLQSFSSSENSRFLRLLEKFSNSNLESSKQQLVLKDLRTASLRSDARRLFIETLSRRGKLDEIPSKIYTDIEEGFVIYDSHGIVFATSLERRSGRFVPVKIGIARHVESSSELQRSIGSMVEQKLGYALASRHLLFGC